MATGIGDSLALLRDLAGMGLGEASEAMHTSPSYLALVETGERRPFPAWAERASRVYADQSAANAVAATLAARAA